MRSILPANNRRHHFAEQFPITQAKGVRGRRALGTGGSERRGTRRKPQTKTSRSTQQLERFNSYTPKIPIDIIARRTCHEGTMRNVGANERDMTRQGGPRAFFTSSNGLEGTEIWDHDEESLLDKGQRSPAAFDGIWSSILAISGFWSGCEKTSLRSDGTLRKIRGLR